MQSCVAACGLRLSPEATSEDLEDAAAVQSPAEVLVAGPGAANDGEPSLCVTVKRKVRPLSALRAKATAEAFLRAVLVPEDRPHIWLRMRVDSDKSTFDELKRAGASFSEWFEPWNL